MKFKYFVAGALAYVGFGSTIELINSIFIQTEFVRVFGLIISCIALPLGVFSLLDSRVVLTITKYYLLLVLGMGFLMLLISVSGLWPKAFIRDFNVAFDLVRWGILLWLWSLKGVNSSR